MIRGKDNLLKWVSSNDCPYWKIYPFNGGKNNFLFASGDEPNLSMDSSIQKLSDSLDILETGRYTIACKTATTQTKGFPEIAFEHQNEKNPAIQSQSVNGSQIGNIGMVDFFEQRLNDKLEKKEAEWEIKRLKEKNEELEKKLKEAESNSTEAALNGVIKRIDPYVDPILDHFFPIEGKTKVAAVGFNGNKNSKSENNNHTSMNGKFTPPAHKPKTDEEASQRSQIALQAWADADPDNFLAMVEKIASVAVNDPNTYKMYVPMLLK